MRKKYIALGLQLINQCINVTCKGQQICFLKWAIPTYFDPFGISNQMLISLETIHISDGMIKKVKIVSTYSHEWYWRWYKILFKYFTMIFHVFSPNDCSSISHASPSLYHEFYTLQYFLPPFVPVVRIDSKWTNINSTNERSECIRYYTNDVESVTKQWRCSWRRCPLNLLLLVVLSVLRIGIVIVVLLNKATH